jgi:2-desacetyl-2-hydroxyethyl bacteriochlorophyllide A dehydrogenase
MQKRQTLYFTAPGRVEVREETLPVPGAGQLLVKTVASAISSGSEMLVYRGQFPHNLADAHDALSSDIAYPVAYGYACVGRIIESGPGVDSSWLGRLVFSFQPHTSHFLAAPESVFPVPDGFSPEAACFLPNMETAVNLVQDGAPILGERVIVLGQGVVGLLTAALLREFPLAALISADAYARRREASGALGVSACLDPGLPDFRSAARDLLGAGADLGYELSGNPSALNDAIALTVFSGRVVLGSWYGAKDTPLALGSSFHRSRIRLVSSQVSSIAPELSGRWDKARRFDVAWSALRRIRPEQWITHRFSPSQAGQAYRLLDQSPAETIQIIFEYDI